MHRPPTKQHRRATSVQDARCLIRGRDLARGSWPARGQAIGDVERVAKRRGGLRAVRNARLRLRGRVVENLRMEAKVALGGVVERANHGSDDAKRQTR